MASAPQDPARTLVVAGVLRDVHGRVLLAQRTRGEHAGRWEFPGGKVEAGEDPGTALRRELHEELGISIGDSKALIDVPQRGPRGPWQLSAREVRDYSGAPRGCEGQALNWVHPESLADFDMPPADLPIAAALRDPALYAITPDCAEADSADLERGLRELIERGAPMRLQWRLPRWSREPALQTLGRWLPALRKAKFEVFLNGTPDEARAMGCGLHLRGTLLERCGSTDLAGLSACTAACHDARALEAAARIGVAAALVSPVLRTATHPDARPIGWEGFVALREGSALPLYALGGLGIEDLGLARTLGAQGIAAIRGLWPAPSGLALS